MTSFLSEVYEQPAALRRVAEVLHEELKAVASLSEKLRHGEFDTIIITGMGSSLAACIPATIVLAEHGIAALALEASELLSSFRALVEAKTLLIVVSQSGQSVEIVRLVHECSGKIPIIGITNTLGSPLAKQSTVVLQMHAGAEETVSTKSYTCALSVLHLLALALLGLPVQEACGDIRQIADFLQKLLPEYETQIPIIAQGIAPVRFIEYLGRGASRASAITAALITKETAKMPTEGMAGGQFRHGPWELLAPDITVCLFCGWRATRHLDRALASDIVTREAKAVMIGPEAARGTMHIAIPDVDPLLAPILEIVPVQLMAAELAKARGLQPGEFRFSGKITTVE
jgi:glucosamine--fructose-6-phosphate aminotransferase (isomerizing)